jgi:predicted DNA-binding transcriptional regulator
MKLTDTSSNVLVVKEETKSKKSFWEKIINKLKIETKLEEEVLEGKSLQIYWYLLTHPQGLAGIREIQKELGISSSGTVAYQVNKLLKSGIISKNEESEKYYIKQEIKSGILGFYIRIGYRLIPRFSIYLVTFIIGILVYFLFFLERGDAFFTDPISWVLLFFLVFGMSIFIFESLKIWRMKPN